MISYPLDFTDLVAAARVEFVGEDVVGMTESPFTLQAQVYDWAADRLRMTITWPPCERADAEAIIAKLLSLRGVSGYFEIRPPGWRAVRGTGGSQAPVVMGAHSAGAATLQSDNWTPSQNGLLLPGDWIQVVEGGYKRFHKALTSVNSNIYGAAAIEIWPRLRDAIDDNVAITLLQPRGTFARAANAQGWTIEQALIYGIEVEVAEYLR